MEMEERKFYPMTVAQLIGELLKFPPECRVVVKGYEGGYNDPHQPHLIHVKVDPFESSVYGDYEDSIPEEQDSFPAVFIDRES